ncbi:MAG: D,D-heptose 1,7-bisphosphate phosphatase, partial [Cytophagales bacterium CG18_big_fil_WC_8_21_14_2_50_42_9]
GEYTYKTEDFNLIPGVKESLQILKAHHYLLVVVTNQAGISKGLYTKQDMEACHQKLQKEVHNLI